MKIGIRYFFLLFVMLKNAYGQNTRDSIVVRIEPKYDKVSMMHRFFLGDSYRKLYNTPVKMPVLDLSTAYGGFKVIKLGGGMQTQSLRLEDAQGREWVLRSIQKYPERSLPRKLRNTIAKDVVMDQISIAHPFGALTVPTFNEALAINHVSPLLVYVGDDPVLGEFRNIFKNRAYMLEPRMINEEVDSDNTVKVIRKKLEDNDKEIDQEMTLRARLLDIVLGDWDRHEDNWRWQPIKKDGKTWYEPVPRDRDKVYYKTSGVFPILLSYQWLKANLQPFGPKIRNIDHWNFNARHFDRFFLNSLDKKDWLEIISQFQKDVTDTIIREAMLHMPDTIVRLTAHELESNIKVRRDSLAITAEPYYKFLSKKVDIPLSAKREFIALRYNNDNTITVDIHNKKKDGTVGRRLYKREFDPAETDEIRVYGIAGEDEYTLNGDGLSSIKVRLIGGKNYDTYVASTDFRRQNKLYVYDQKKPDSNNIELGKGVRYRLSNDTNVNSYNYDAFVYNRKGMLFDFNYGTDKGLTLGLGYLIQNQGFRQSPFSYSHSLMGTYVTGRRTFMFDYKGEYKQIWKQNDLLIDIDVLGPNNLYNFFGFGNETIFVKTKENENQDYGINYYRNRYDIAEANFYLRKNINSNLSYYYGSSSQFYSSAEKNNLNKFLNSFHQSNPNEFIYGTKYFTGATVGFYFDSRNRKDLPQWGILFQSELAWKHELGKSNRNYLKSSNSFNIYKSFLNDRFTIAERVGVDAVWGDPYFYQYVQLGGEHSLRGFNSRRFTGKTGMYNNLDVRIKIFESFSYVLPASVGVIGFYDVGRVWMTHEKSNVWHNSLGGGLFIMPADLFVIQAVVGRSKEATLPYIRIGMSF